MPNSSWPMRFTLLSALYLSIPSNAVGSEAWRGTVLERGGGRAIPGAVLESPEGVTLAASGSDGAFEILSPSAKVRVSADGYDPLTVTAGTRRVFLLRSDFVLDEVDVTGKKYAAPGESSVAGEDMRRIAGAMGDALRTLDTLPGVVATGDLSGQLSIQGGGPDDNQYYIDGVPWAMPYHYGGVLGTVSPSILDSVELHAAGFPVQYGDASGAILEAQTRPGKDRFFGTADISLLSSELTLEGPLTLDPDTHANWTLSGRRSYWDLGSNGSIPSYDDLSSTFRFQFGPQNTLRLIFLRSNDSMSYTLPAGYDSGPYAVGPYSLEDRALTAGLNWETQGDGWRNRTVVYWYDTNEQDQQGYGFYDNIEMQVWGFRDEAELDLAKNNTLGMGVGFEKKEGTFSFRDYVGSQDEGGTYFLLSDLRDLTGTAAQQGNDVYLQDHWQALESLGFTGGLRFDHAQAQSRGAQSTDALDPRLALQWDPWTGGAVRLAWGLYSQAPDSQQWNSAAGNAHLTQTQGQHLVAGLDQRLGGSFRTRLEVYHKTWTNLVVEVPSNLVYANNGVGQAEGADLSLQYDDKRRFFGWLSAAYSQSERKDSAEGPWYLYQYDEPWVLSLAASARLTRRFTLGSTISYHTGALFTPISAGPGSTDANPNPEVGVPFSQRLPDYFRWDAKGEYTWSFKYWKLGVYLDVLNITDSPNPNGWAYSQDYSTRYELTQIPILPYMGITATF